MPNIASSGNMGPFPVIPHGILVNQKHGEAITIWEISAFCIFGWELIVCLPKEYRLVWRKPMNIFSLLYLTNRYFGLIEFFFGVILTIDTRSPSACKHVFLFEPIAGLISTILSQAILGGRVFAIYSRNKALGYLLGMILLTEAVVGGVSVSTSSPPLSIPIPPPGSQLPCGASGGPFAWLIAYWTMPLLYDSLTFLLTAWKAYDYWKRELKTPIFGIIWFDGLVYFFANLSMNIINVMIFFLAPSTLQHFNMAPTIMFQVILSCRMFLHLKGSNPQTDLSSNKPNSSNILRFRSFVSNGTSSRGHSENTSTSGVIPIGTKQGTIVRASEYEHDARAKPSEEGWDMA